jgi:hypothetical protein
MLSIQHTEVEGIFWVQLQDFGSFKRRMKSTLIILIVGLLAFLAEASLVRVQNGKFVDEGCKEFHFTGKYTLIIA